ncbi:MAG: hypothetical protein U0736_17660 [Gemmataceae bacterium]
MVQTVSPGNEGLDNGTNGTITLGEFGGSWKFTLTSGNGISDGSAVVLSTDLTLGALTRRSAHSPAGRPRRSTWPATR